MESADHTHRLGNVEQNQIAAARILERLEARLSDQGRQIDRLESSREGDGRVAAERSVSLERRLTDIERSLVEIKGALAAKADKDDREKSNANTFEISYKNAFMIVIAMAGFVGIVVYTVLNHGVPPSVSGIGH